MTESESTFNQWKEDTRREALQKELDRIKNETQKQNKVISRLRSALIIITLLALSSWLSLFIFNNTKENNTSTSLINIESISPSDSIALIAKLAPERKKENPIPKLEIMTPDGNPIEFYIPEDGIFFSIQIGAYLGVNMERFRQNMVSLHQSNYGGINQFTLGLFPTYREADVFREIVKKMGFKDAYIIATQNGNRIKIQDALNLRIQEQNMPPVTTE